jgi:hypothetical protein
MFLGSSLPCTSCGWVLIPVFLLRIIIEYSSFKGFCPYQLGEIIHLNLVEKNSHSYFDILFSLPPPQMCTQPNWLCHQSIITKLNMKILSPKIVMAPIISTNWYVTMLLKTFKYTCHDESFFLVWNFAQMWKINMKRKYLVTFFFEEKVIRFAKNKKLCYDISLLVLVW